jgi:hypothetical protein
MIVYQGIINKESSSEKSVAVVFEGILVADQPQACYSPRLRNNKLGYLFRLFVVILALTMSFFHKTSFSKTLGSLSSSKITRCRTIMQSRTSLFVLRGSTTFGE